MTFFATTLKFCSNLKPADHLVYIIIDAYCDYGRLISIFTMFHKVAMVYPIVIILIMGLYSH